MSPDKDAIRSFAVSLGFDVVRFTRIALNPAVQAGLDAFLADGLHGEMTWMETTRERRRDPLTLWPEAKSAIVVGLNYGPDEDPREILLQRKVGAISVYARNRDYHDVLKKKLKRLASWLHEQAKVEVKVFVDTAPVMEKPLAQSAGVGWQGKHTNLVSREFGSWLFLGEVFTALEIEPDAAETDHCGVCRKCLDICPTQAFLGEYRIDARRCISYLTIEHKGHIPRELRPLIGNRIYGCDDCLAVCPWNKFAKLGATMEFRAREDLSAPRLAELVSLDDAGFRKLFASSPIKRIGRNRFIRNVLIAIGNSADPGLSSAVESTLDDDSPLVRLAAVWALRQLVSPLQFEQCRQRHALSEADNDVRAEWNTAIS
ncbi:MAG: tRNA epoxyqueuosine(34) reductase QueG [Rhodospirillaceae bacterium]|nr:tRNA epoxyqueuosine(34) reductase QueG [Rhodospirillaceae bacterium]